MAADQSLCPMDFTGRQDEWLDFDSLFDLPSDYLDSNPTSVDSISPRDLDQPFTDAEFMNWDSELMYSQPMFPDFSGLGAPLEGLDQPLDFDSFINPNDALQAVLSDFNFVDPGFDVSWPAGQGLEDSFRYMVESQAALDTRCFSQKEKRRDASIALHLQRMNAPLPQATPTIANSHLSSPDWSISSLETPGGQSPAVASTGSQSPSTEPAGAMEMVLDLNMNTTTNVPKKQKPRSRAQRENYIKARKYGVCEKHRKQHKRCNCLEKAAISHLNANANAAHDVARTSCLQTNHERMILNKSPRRSIQSSTAANAGSLSLSDQPVRAPRPHVLPPPTQPLAPTSRDSLAVRRPIDGLKRKVEASPLLQTPASSLGREATNPFTGSQSFTSSGALNAPARFRHKNSQGESGLQARLIQGERLCQTIRQPLDHQPLASRVCQSCTDSQSRTSSRKLHISVRHSMKDSQEKNQIIQRVVEEKLRQPSPQSLVQVPAGLLRRTVSVHAQTPTRADIPSFLQSAGSIIQTTASSIFSVLQSPAAAAAAALAGSFLSRFANSSSRLFGQYRKGMGLV